MNPCFRRSPRGRVDVATLAWALLALLAGASAIEAQVFDSGSTGADGAFAPPMSQVVPLPESGVFNFTTVSIASGVVITFLSNSRNTPVTILASGDVTINGHIGVEGFNANQRAGGAGGPGGFRGGLGGLRTAGFRSPVAGDGPGGGGAGRPSDESNTFLPGGGGGFGSPGANGLQGGRGGPSYGSSRLLPLIGGSGGGGGAARAEGDQNGGGGGGGGGAILIASSGEIRFNSGLITANGGLGFLATSGPGGGGSGGAIRLVGTTIGGNPGLRVNGATCCGTTAGGGFGYVRLEAFNFTPDFSPGVNPEAALSIGRPGPARIPDEPGLRIVSVAGISAPATPAGSLQGLPDVLVPAAQTNPVAVLIHATNIPLPANVLLTLITEAGERTQIEAPPLTGTDASSMTTASISLPASGTSVLTAIAVIELPSAGPSAWLLDGEPVVRVEVAARFGSTSHVAYITRSGRRFDMSTAGR